ncbi:D-lactate dehydrogenase [Acetobacteraceae bacterium KSS8]|uniref:Quinone-dependent D-lactate dehydrogenase n=1 Tax=Endosaccharibacter trunci TaxID=2812733 RepID=A0ABT1W9I8_9PROT|nr:D-lactate dehydrogenase [Acetobacteraceae bacterium KSS8]
MRPGERALVSALSAIVGRKHVLTGPARTRRFRHGYRTGEGPCLAVARPGTLLEQWRVVQACVAADCIVLMQAANTGLTGGSTPDGDDYDRPIVIVSTLRMNRVRLLGGGRQALCFPGATLDLLERTLKPLGREPHSVIGSSCLGASVMGGVANNSGGALVRRGPVYTELSLFARVDRDGRLALVNKLGIALGADPETILDRLDRDAWSEDAVSWEGGRAHDADYATRVRDTHASEPARFNADPGRLQDASGSAGKLILFAVRLDTFPAEPDAVCFYAGTDLPERFATLRRRILEAPQTLPIACEYIHRDAFDLADRYGKDTVLLISRLGTARLPGLFALKARVDRIAERVPFLPDTLSDRVMQRIGALFPDHLPARMRQFRDRFAHHLLIKVSAADAEAMCGLLTEILGAEGFFRCSASEASRAFLHRFATAGAAVRYRALHPRSVPDIVAIDVALPRNAQDWFERLPADFDALTTHRLYYGHFLCHVLHQDYIPRPGVDPHALEQRILDTLTARGAHAPAEHNVGHLYQAPPSLAGHYRELDPCNCFNPGIGRTSKLRCWGEAA